MGDIDFFDPHFHIWDLSAGTESGHDASILFKPDGADVFDVAAYEAQLENSAGLQPVGGVYLEAMSVCHPDMGGEALNALCLKEARWTAAQLAKSERPYLLAASCALEAPNAADTLAALAAMPTVRGVRQVLNFAPDWPRNGNLGGDLLANEAWRRGYGLLAAHKLSFDLQLNPPQYAAAAAFVAGHPDVPVIINHLGCPTLADLTEPARAAVVWDGMAALAALPHVSIKLSMLCYCAGEGGDWAAEGSPVAEAVHRVIGLFGSERCFFASNYPVDAKDGWTADRLFGAFKEAAARYSPEEQANLFANSARKAYRA